MRPEPPVGDQLDTVADPPVCYRLTGSVLMLPESLPEQLHDHLTDERMQRLESGAILYGYRAARRSGEPDRVAALVIPGQRNYRGHYRVPADAISTASAATRDRGWVTLAQIHTHPGRLVEHSWYDDRNAISIRALSFVLPHYGNISQKEQWLTAVGVHEYQNDWWHLLPAQDVPARVTFTPTGMTVLDLRLPRGTGYE